MLRNFFLILLSFFLGVGTGIGAIKLTSPQMPIGEILYSPLSFSRSKTQIIGFMPFWLVNKTPDSYRKQITTITYFSLTIDSDGKIKKLVNPQEEEPGWTTLKKEKLQQILQKARKEKLTISLLVHSSDEESIAELLENPTESAQNLIKETAPIMKEYDFTDLNLDIESFKKATPSSQLAFITFLQEVKNGIEQNKLGTLTVEITPISLIKSRLTLPEEIGKIADYIVLMAYDYHYIYSYLTGPVAPLGGVPDVREFDVETAVSEAVKVIPSKKLILGIPLYGYEWETVEEKVGAGIIPGSGKTASNRRVEELLASCQNCMAGIEEEGQQPYLIIPENKYFRQIFYENEDSLEKKIDLARSYKLGGVAVWALGYEGKSILNPLRLYKNKPLSSFL